MDTEAYNAQRSANIKNNTELLQKLGLADPLAFVAVNHNPVKQIAQTKKKPVVKRKREEDEETVQIEKKAPRINAEGARRSSRLAAQPIDYSEDALEESNRIRAVQAKTKKKRALSEDRTGRAHNKVGERTQDPKQFGHIPGVPVGTCWEFRTECSKDAVHAPVVAGIAGNTVDGAYSVALSGGYDDDVDLGYAFTYTGAGGRDLSGTKDAPKNLRTGPQVCDQTFDNPRNRALQISCETRNPVRVIRGYKLPSIYAPETGYRYDGLYIVEKAWMDRGINEHGYKVCKYALKRLPGQPPIPERFPDGEKAENAKEEEDTKGEPEDATSNYTSPPPSSAADEDDADVKSEP
ncbi:hypothetical protein FRC17_006324 [Serendipita sp. 399]|nr:hypothetical protein FRC17_006324 [Serendipita sp. 399]